MLNGLPLPKIAEGPILLTENLVRYAIFWLLIYQATIQQTSGFVVNGLIGTLPIIRSLDGLNTLF